MTRTVRNVEISGHRTSFRLEEPFWRAAAACAQERGMTIGQLFTDVVEECRDHKATMSSMVRTYLICHFRDRVVGGRSK
jgi:predicted DNA-binding ribbon-helix-helix protein